MPATDDKPKQAISGPKSKWVVWLLVSENPAADGKQIVEATGPEDAWNTFCERTKTPKDIRGGRVIRPATENEINPPKPKKPKREAEDAEHRDD